MTGGLIQHLMKLVYIEEVSSMQVSHGLILVACVKSLRKPPFWLLFHSQGHSSMNTSTSWDKCLFHSSPFCNGDTTELVLAYTLDVNSMVMMTTLIIYLTVFSDYSYSTHSHGIFRNTDGEQLCLNLHTITTFLDVTEV